MRSIVLRELMTVEVRVQPVTDLGGGRRYVAFEGGTFEVRDGLVGTLLEGGIDWQRVRPDGTLEIDAHYTLSTDAGEQIEVRSIGLRKASDPVSDRIARGESVDPAEYYFRTHIRFFTASPHFAWLNDLIALSTARRDKDIVGVDIHVVL
ncbi:MAG: DUF3237 family protein [Acidimicrobiales bacterium]